MRLLRADTLEPMEFFSDELPEYAILSHTWGDEEVTYQDLTDTDRSWQTKAGWAKIKATAQQARLDNREYIWVDTCCIDKKSSAELQETINSMFKWYSDSSICYAYLPDFAVPAGYNALRRTNQIFATARPRWFSRGWTLQGLIAPRNLVFFDKHWRLIGYKDEMILELAQITGIPMAVLKTDSSYDETSIGERMSWTSNRYTTRKEDMAYCMLGLFNIHMPMLYGEGDKAFRRLQEEIIKVSADPTIFAWSATSFALGRGKSFEEPWEADRNAWMFIHDPKSSFETSVWTVPLLASSPRKYCISDNLIPFDALHPHYLHNGFSMTQRGLEMNLLLVEDRNFANLAYGILNCGSDSSAGRPVAFPILLDRPQREWDSKDSVTPSGVALFDGSMPCSFTSDHRLAKQATVCLKRSSFKSIPTDSTEFTLSTQIRERYSSYLGYPPCLFNGSNVLVGALTGRLERFLLWIQDSSTEEKHMLIRFRASSDREGELEWTGEATLYKGPPTIEDLIEKYSDNDFWIRAERYAGHDVPCHLPRIAHFGITWVHNSGGWHPELQKGEIHLACGQCELLRGELPQTLPRRLVLGSRK